MNPQVRSALSGGSWVLLAVLCGVLSGCTDPHSPGFTNNHDPQSVVYVPGAPIEVSVSPVRDQLRTITWVNTARSPERFLIERKEGREGLFSEIGEAPGDVKQFIDTTVLRTDTEYFYRVTAMSAFGSPSPSESVRVFLQFPAPHDVCFTCLSPDTIELGWSDDMTFADGYSILRSVDGGPFAEFIRLPRVSGSSVRIGGLESSRRYRFSVRAYTRDNMSAPSLPLSISAVVGQPRLLGSHRNSMEDLALYSIDFLPGGREMVCGGPQHVDRIRVGDCYSRTLFDQNAASPPWSLRCSPDGMFLASSADRGNIHVWSLYGSYEMMKLSGPDAQGVYCIRFTPDGRTMVASTDRTLDIWDFDARSFLRSYPCGNSSNGSIDISPDGKYIVSGDSMRVIRLSDGAEIMRSPDALYSQALVFSPSGDHIARFDGRNHKLVVVRTVDGSEVWSVPEADYYHQLAFSSDGKYIAGGGWYHGEVKVRNADTGELVMSFTSGKQVYSIAFSPLNNIIVTGDWEATARVWGLPGCWGLDQ